MCFFYFVLFFSYFVFSTQKKKTNSHKEFAQIAHFKFDGIALLDVENRQNLQFFLLKLNCKTKFYCCLLRRIVSIVSLCFVIFLRLINKSNTVTFSSVLRAYCVCCKVLRSLYTSLRLSQMRKIQLQAFKHKVYANERKTTHHHTNKQQKERKKKTTHQTIPIWRLRCYDVFRPNKTYIRLPIRDSKSISFHFSSFASSHR